MVDGSETANRVSPSPTGNDREATLGDAAARYRRILETCQPYIVSATYGSAAEAFRLPFGLRIDDGLRFDPHRVDSGPFLTQLQRLDELTYGPVGMPMPRWVFYDCAEVPGGIFGFARPAPEVPLWVKYALDVADDYVGPIPLSMYVAIPRLNLGSWHMYTVCSLNTMAPGAGPAGLMQFTQGTGLLAFGIRVAYGVTQWRSSKLANHARFGPLDLVTAWTPAHSDPTTLTFRFPVTAERVEAALLSDAPPTPARAADVRWIDCDEREDMRALQADIEAGRQFQVIGAPVVEGSYTRVPVREVTP